MLVADDDAAIRMVLNQALSRAGYEVRPTGNAATLWRWVSRGEGDLVITDVVMPDGTPSTSAARSRSCGRAAGHRHERAEHLHDRDPRIEGALTNTCRSRSTQGTLPSSPARCRAEEAARPTATKDDEPGETMPLVGRSPAMQDIYRVLARLMQTDLTVMITGESGTGKELVARALHDFGKRRNGPFVAINMAAIPRDLIEAELFGHEKGAFTGAHARSSGRFEQAEGGTLFLDEIGDMPMEAQTRLLRVLQQGEYTMVGGRTPIKSTSASSPRRNKDLSILIRQGLFREDLFTASTSCRSACRRCANASRRSAW
jgi:two-component system nitrogen regulation response regulator GlnG